MISQSLVHAHTHLQALTNLAERLKIHLHVEKAQAEKDNLQHTSEWDKQDEKTSQDTAQENAHFKFPSVGPFQDSEFLKMVESMVEGSLLETLKDHPSRKTCSSGARQ